MRGPTARLARQVFALPLRWWDRQSLRARLTLLATALFSFAVLTGAILLIFLQGYSLTRVLDQSAGRTSADIAKQVRTGNLPRTVEPTTGGITAVQVLDRNNLVLAASSGADHITSLLTESQLDQVRAGDRPEIQSPTSTARLRVLGRRVGSTTVAVFTDISRVEDSQRILTQAALIGGPLAVLLMAGATYFVVALTLRSVAALRNGAAAISAAGLSEQRLPVPDAQDEIHRLAVTLNAMLDRIDSATSRQRTFVGDAAHELRSPLASLRVQLEVAQRLGPQAADWPALFSDVLIDVDRLDRLVADLLALARLDEAGRLSRRQRVELDQVVEGVAAGYAEARVPVRVETSVATVDGDPDALRRVAINLIDNAVRHARAGVQVTVGVEDGQCVLAVEDDGAGIPEAERERAFDRFYRVQQSRSRESGGTGLGLAIVRDVVRAHGGQVHLTGRADGTPGLRAVVSLPAA